jgi:ketosteroid isomerase-like protein
MTGCGVSAKDEVQAKVEQFARATASKDVQRLCTQVLAPALVSRLTAAGISCDQAMKIFVQSVSDPTISVTKITVNGSRASAVVLAGATGQTAALERIALIQTAKGWRLASLASPR